MRVIHPKPLWAVLFLLTSLCNDAYPFCFQEAGQMYGINALVLRSIAKVESNTDPAAVNKNSNGTYDRGLMQINSIWKPLLGEERWNRLGDACYNTKTGAWILAMCINKYGYNWKALGCYHSQTPELSELYARKVFSQLKQLEQGKQPQPLDADVEAAIRGQIDELVESAQQGKKIGKKKVFKFVPYVRLSPRQLRQPPPLPEREPLKPVAGPGSPE
jgi:soluble lytic murein transglycosylase-like protein